MIAKLNGWRAELIISNVRYGVGKMSLSKNSINLAWMRIRHEEIGRMLSYCGLKADATYTLHNEQWDHIEFLLKLLEQDNEARTP